MIDVSDDVVSAPTQQPRRRASGSTAKTASRRNAASKRTSLTLERVFSDPRVSPFDQVEWERRTAEITDDAGKVIF